MKERKKNNKTRTYDSDGYTQRAGCLCFKTEQEQEVLLVTSNRFPDQWIVPAGGVEHGESFHDAAIREVGEEAGVSGSIQRSLGIFQNDVNRSRTMVYSFVVKQEFDVWQDAANGRRRGWFPLDKALVLLSRRPHQQLYLMRAMNMQLLRRNPPKHHAQSCQLSSSRETQWINNGVVLCVDSNY